MRTDGARAAPGAGLFRRSPGDVLRPGAAVG